MWVKFVFVLLLVIASLVFQLFPKTHQQTEVLNAIQAPSFLPKTPTLESVFSNDHSWTATLSAKNVRTMMATGDIMPARSVNSQVLKYKDFNWPYLKTADVLRQADITFINLETPLFDMCPPTQEGMIFCGDARNVDGLVFAGVDIANLANNHAGNYGDKGVDKTVRLLNNNDILTIGINGPVFKDIRGIKFAFLGYNDISTPQPGISNADEERIRIEIKDAKRQANIVIVAFHFGAEYRDQPDDRQIYLGHLAIDSGADLVIGNHPHWIQPIEIYKDKVITYAHGNFVFDQEWSQKTKEGVVGKYTFYENKLIDIEFLPVLIENYGQPYFLNNNRKIEILDRMRIETLRLSSSQ
ncbi:CapA family protein [Candidatus Roizmanbacteria bacterium]|nr:CapA family protein [Candidatus Roizmanbacteria bacterium]